MQDPEQAALLAKALVVAESELQRQLSVPGKLAAGEEERLRYNTYLEVIKLWMKAG